MAQLKKVDVTEREGNLSVSSTTKSIRNVRNFFIELSVDGKKTRITTGPRRKDGGFQLDIFMRDESNSKRALYVSGTVIGNDLLLMITIPNDREVSQPISNQNTQMVQSKR